MSFDRLEIGFGPDPCPESLYDFMRTNADDTCLWSIASADYSEKNNEIFALLAATLKTGKLPKGHEKSWQFQECITLASGRDELPITRFVSLSLLFHLESENALPCFIDHDNKLADLVSTALDHSPTAAIALAPFVSWLSLNDAICWPRSFHVLALLLLMFSTKPECIGPAEIEILERVFDDELRRNASEVIGYKNDYSGYDDALGMIADGSRSWLLCLDTSTKRFFGP